jgi:adenine-specific DNA-methyltransferase
MGGFQTEFIATSIKGSCNLFDQSVVEPAEVNGDTINQSNFPKTRYYGSKLRLLEWISACASDLDFQSALDAFGGTASVSLLLKHLNKDVTYNDILSSNQYVAKALLHNDRPFSTAEVSKFYESVRPAKEYISRTFSGHYFYDFENEWLDGAVGNLHRLRSEQKKSDLFYCLIQAALQKRPFNLFHRKNLYIRQNCGRNTKFGNWRTWEKPFTEHINNAAIELLKAKKISTGNANILPPTDASEIPAGFDLVYIDPPYLKERGTGNNLTYLDRYHFLEGMANYSDWAERINKQKKNFPFLPVDSITEWNSKNTFKARLFDFITYHRNSMVILSYATNGYPSIEEITTHFKDNFKNVIILKKQLSHALRKSSNEEILILGI